ncbi:hypothetical protein HU200_013199 [Digitaria exilis]|uniref:RING-type E3 ubiquitin transferase n=1 Tax=Digitaria exilis TaxID=1010633 RepID=A0A835KML5_9POAL|nr:hypothetical protein HU200_013199 [Digitaria exilis]
MALNNGRRLLVLIAVALAGAAMDTAAAQSSSPPGGPGPNYFDPKNISPNMAIVMVVLVLAFFLLGFFSIYLRRCAGPPLGEPDDDEYPSPYNRRHDRHGLGFTYASRSSRRAPRGLDRAVLESFPTMAYADVKAHKGGGPPLECAVCLSEFDDDETLRLLLPRCAHAFHVDCIDAWLASHVTCPVCRAVLSPNYDAPATPAAASFATEQAVPVAPPQEQVEAVVVVDVEDGEETTEEERIRREEAEELMRIGGVKRALRSKSGRAPFRRSHTTGHSLAAAPSPAPETEERYTLRLPEHVLREVLAAGSLRRSASVQTGGGGGSARRAGRSVRLGSSSGRWPYMSVLARNFSARLPAWGSGRRGEADAPGKGAKKVAGDGRAVEECDGGACPLGAHV